MGQKCLSFWLVEVVLYTISSSFPIENQDLVGEYILPYPPFWHICLSFTPSKLLFTSWFIWLHWSMLLYNASLLFLCFHFAGIMQFPYIKMQILMLAWFINQMVQTMNWNRGRVLEVELRETKKIMQSLLSGHHIRLSF